MGHNLAKKCPDEASHDRYDGVDDVAPKGHYRQSRAPANCEGHTLEFLNPARARATA